MSDATPPPEGGAISCPRCAAPVGRDQDWCLACGAAVRTRLAQPPNWKLPIAGLASVVALSLVALALAFATLTGDPELTTGATGATGASGPTAVAPAPAPGVPPAPTGPTGTPAPSPVPVPPVTTVPPPPAPGATGPTTPPSATTGPSGAAGARPGGRVRRGNARPPGAAG